MTEDEIVEWYHHFSGHDFEQTPGDSKSVQSVQSLSRVRLFATPRTAARQASLSLTISQSYPKFMSIRIGANLP